MSEPREMTAEELERVLGEVDSPIGPPLEHKLRAHIAALTARAESARDAALEDAAEAAKEWLRIHVRHHANDEDAEELAADIRALKSRPAERMVPAREVVGVLRHMRIVAGDVVIDAALETLGLKVDE